jgi:hypothetical protein
MVPKVSQLKEEWADREGIRDCMYRYSRGIDRCDMELLQSVYWPGAMDHHTGFDGTAEEFIAWAGPRLRAMSHNVHMIGNIFIRLKGATAAVESYFWAVSVLPEGPTREIVTSGRYVDRFERRNDEWRVAERWVTHDYFREAGNTGDWAVGPFGMSGLELGAARPHDKSHTFLGLDWDRA